MRLSAFIKGNTKGIIGEWEDFARSLIPAASDMTPLALRDHITDILAFIVKDIERPQTSEEQKKKSHGEGKQRDMRRSSAAVTHAALRLAGGFSLDQMVSEYRALRASVITLWMESRREVNNDDLQDLIRFNEAIDQALTESISHYAKKLGDSKDLFLGILTHDLRNPLGAMLGAAELIPLLGPISERQKLLAAQITDSGGRIKEIITHLLDITKARFGSGLPVVRSEMDMAFVARQIVDEMRTQHPERKFALEISGELEGNWDKARIGQVFSNLLGNAVQYSFKDSSIGVTLRGEAGDVTLAVHNEGNSIPPEQLGGIFDSLTRAITESDENNAGVTTNLGLGLFITREIVSAHGGKIRVNSDEKAGTTFTASFPRKGKAGDPEDANFAAPEENTNSLNAERRLH